MPKYYSHGMAPYVYDWRGRAYSANENGSRAKSELSGTDSTFGSVLTLGAMAVGGYLLYKRLFGSGKVRMVRR